MPQFGGDTYFPAHWYSRSELLCRYSIWKVSGNNGFDGSRRAGVDSGWMLDHPARQELNTASGDVAAGFEDHAVASARKHRPKMGIDKR